eukprot:6890508-Heterocapsa_arctica.AAC.1
MASAALSSMHGCLLWGCSTPLAPLVPLSLAAPIITARRDPGGPSLARGEVDVRARGGHSWGC